MPEGTQMQIDRGAHNAQHMLYQAYPVARITANACYQSNPVAASANAPYTRLSGLNGQYVHPFHNAVTLPLPAMQFMCLKHCLGQIIHVDEQSETT